MPKMDIFLTKPETKVRKIALLFLFTSVVSAMAFLIILRAVQIGISLLFVALGLSLFIILDKRDKNRENLRNHRIDSRIINLFFVFALLTSLTILIINEIPLFRPISFFICVALMFGIIAIEIVNLNKDEIKKLQTFSVLTKAMVVSFLFKSTFFMGIYFTGFDVIRHFENASMILSTGSTRTLGYSETPIYHLLWAIYSLVAGVDLNSTKFILLIFPILGIPFMYLFCKVFTGDEKSSLYSALIFSFFTLTNRIRIQTEAFVFPILFLILFYFLFHSEKKTIEDNLIIVILSITLICTHFYYSGLFVIWLSLAFLTVSLFNAKYTDTFRYEIRNIFILNIVLWVYKISSSSTKLGWLTKNIIKVINFLSILTLDITLDIEPAFLSAGTTSSQFLLIHLSELLFVSLTVAAMFLLIERINGKKLLLIVPFMGFTFITIIGIFIEGQNYLAWGVSFRNFYLIALFLVTLGGYTISKIEYISRNQQQITLMFFVLFFVLSFFSATSRQTNTLDPIFYSGLVPSPNFVSYEEIKTSYNLLSHLPNYSIILSDIRTLESIHFASSNIHENSYQFKRFNDPDLPELMERYDYLIIGKYSIERGMIFHNVKKGLAINNDMLLNEAEYMDKIWNGGAIQVFCKK